MKYKDILCNDKLVITVFLCWRLIASPQVIRGNYNQRDLKAIRTCLMCRRDIQNRGFGREISGNRGSAPMTRGVTECVSLLMSQRGMCSKYFGL